MKIESIKIEGFQGINWLNLSIKTPILLVAGENNSGKTTIVDAIRFALSSVTDRVHLKKEYPTLVHEGFDAKKAAITVVADGVKYARKVATGKSTENYDFPFLYQYVDGTKKYTCIDRKERQEVITEISQLKVNRETVATMMKQRGIGEEGIEMTLPLLRSGFDAASKAAKSKESEAKGAWVAITGEKRYGAIKAEAWTAPEPDTSGLAPLQERLLEINTALTNAEEKLNKIKGQRLDMSKQQGIKTQCPCCDADIWVMNGEVSKFVEESQPDVEGQKRLDHLIKGGNDAVGALVRERLNVEYEISQLLEMKPSQELTDRAKGYYDKVETWANVADALSPNGIPLQIMNDSLKPINDHLKATSTSTGWGLIQVRSDLEVTIDGRAYGLLSESEKWRVDIVMAEMISKLSGLKIFIVDRFDVLSIQNRGKCLKWLMSVAADHDTIMILGTLKALPAKFPPQVSGFWLEYGKQQEVA